ncbi:MAG: spermidine synthase, partial [Deltaproteobacteria bacterium]|nr:spermidine synthase [Deltaproteobacteria bacterium]
MSGRPSANYLILAFFFLTGLTGLAYELVWIRLLILAFGSTQFAVTTVLVVFMAGLALGSLIFGRIADRTSSPLKLYAIIEVALGVYCILSPAIFTAIKGAYLVLGGHSASTGVSATFEAPQFALSFLALIIPTTLMGGTLPALVKYLASGSGRIGFHTAVPYSVNTLGAVAGCLLTGFLSLYVLGVKTTVYTAGVIDIIVGVLVYALYGRASSAPVGPRAAVAPQGAKAGSGKRLLIIASFALSGFASLNYEVLWSRLLSLVLGSSVYAFTIMLATFLVGIGLGSIVFAPFIDRRKNLIAWFALFEAVIGVVSLVSIFVYRELPFVFFSLKESFASQFWLFM